MNEPEELPLSDLIDDEFEHATRVLPKTQMASYPPVAMFPAPAPKKSDAPLWAAVLGATFVFALAAVGVAVFLFVQHRRADDVDTTAAALAPTATETAAAAPTVTVAATATPNVAATENLEPLAVAAPRATTHAAPVPHGSGTLQTFSIGRGKTIWVDGKAVGIGGTRVKTACGRHSVVVGTSKARTYEIPCNGSTLTVGTADGS